MAAMDALMDFSRPVDVPLFEQVVLVFNNAAHPERARASAVLHAFMEHPQAWTRVDALLDRATDPSAKIMALKILEDTVRFRWQPLPPEQKEAVKTYVVNKIISLAASDAGLARDKQWITKLNLVLVQILKHEWPHNWPTFISEIVNASKTSESMCENNMEILKLLSEEVFDYSKDEMTSRKARELKESLNKEFMQVYQLCEFVLEHSTRQSLLRSTLLTLLRFLSWIPLGYIFETTLIERLVLKFFPAAAFRNAALMCLTEIATLSEVEQYTPKLQQMYMAVAQQLTTVIPPTTDLAAAYERSSSDDQDFVQKLALFFTGLFSTHLEILETDTLSAALLQGMHYLVQLTAVDDEEIFKICLEYWQGLTKREYNRSAAVKAGMVLALGGSSAKPGSPYAPMFAQLREIVIDRMAKPEEVLVVQDESGEVVRESITDTDQSTMYQLMRTVLVYLTHLDVEHTEGVMLRRLAAQMSGQEWAQGDEYGRKRLNVLCWAIGSISGTMTEDDEKRFLVAVIRDLLGLCEVKRGKDNKAVIASNIMYVVGQYPRFLLAHWKFLKTVVNKLFEFMHELHPGVQDMACDTFLKISKKCRKKFTVMQPGEVSTFVEELLHSLPRIIGELQPHQVHTFYHAVGYMVQAIDDPGYRTRMLELCMTLPNSTWSQILGSFARDPSSLMNARTVKELTKVLRTNVRICETLGTAFAPQLSRMFTDLLQLYKAFSEHISSRVAASGSDATRLLLERNMIAFKREALVLLETFLSKNSDTALVRDSILPAMLEPVLLDYKRSQPAAREHEVLALFVTVVNRLRHEVAPHVGLILDATFSGTLDMITKNFTDYPDHRLQFYRLIEALNKHCFNALFDVPPPSQKLIVDSILWGIKHEERNISELSLEILHALLRNIAAHGALAQPFFQAFYLPIMHDVLYVLTDRLHKSGLAMHASILHDMVALVQSGGVTVPLWDASTPVPAGMTNQQFLREHLLSLLASSFPHQSRVHLQEFVVGLFDLAKSEEAYKQHLRDFLVQLKEFSGDVSELYQDEQRKQAEESRQRELAAKKAVPGLLNPHELDEDL